MSSVFLSNVDDYLGPSQACVNPLFSNTSTTTATTIETNNQKQEHAGAVRTRKRRTVRGPGTSVAFTEPLAPTSPVQASIADCLACSGCVTTAETVLLEETHSIEKLRQWIQSRRRNHDDFEQTKKRWFVLTISPASWADLMRHAFQDSSTTSSTSIRVKQQQMATFFHHYWTANVVMDANVPLEWSRRMAAQSFVQAYQQQQQETTQRRILPQIASSCPATVCLIEKSIHAAVPHLSPIMSPMSCAGAYWKQQQQQQSEECFHLAVMPCHDKKLEASRTEFAVTDDAPLVDMSITTTECWQLMQDFCPAVRRKEEEKTQVAVKQQQQHVAEIVSQLPLAPVCTSVDEWKKNSAQPSSGCCLIVPQETKSVEASQRDNNNNNSTFFAESSGGYADFIFRYAARELFQTDIVELSTTLWQPYYDEPSSNVDRSKTVVSARIASQKRRREFRQATLYHHPSTGSYNLVKGNHDDDARPVLRFAIANGMQTIQAALKPFQDEDELNSIAFDYVEIMACPSGCINGGGQIRTAVRETPTETRERIWTSQEQYFQVPSSTTGIKLPWTSTLETQYRVIPPMQHTMGAAAGIPVKDAIW